MNNTVANLINVMDLEKISNWNQTHNNDFLNKNIVELFEDQVNKSADKNVLYFKQQSLTYKQLNTRSNQLAHYLIQQGIKPESFIGIYVQRSVEMLISLLAVLKAGAAYVPLDLDYPQDRLQYILDDAGVSTILTQDSLQSSLTAFNAKTISVDTNSNIFSSHSTQNPNNKIIPSQLAYAIYTSGTTGKPKGVMIEHCALANFLLAMKKELSIDESDHFMAITRIIFDIATLELFLPLISGASIRLSSPEDAHRAISLGSYLAEDSITLVQTTPSTWQMLLNSNWRPHKNMRVLSGGEALYQELAEQLLSTGAQLWNMYGPTETTVWSSMTQIESSDSINIGYPIANTQIYILDKQHQLVPIGKTGELCISGDGLARGYINRKQLTDERFIFLTGKQLGLEHDNPVRLYKTGDLAHWNKEGKLECLGRIDHQVKLRGFRIELGEIEQVLLQQENVKLAAVIIREDRPGIKQLVAYLVADKAKNIDKQQLIDALGNKLPEYMIPNLFVVLENMPLTFSGKIDRNALPEPDSSDYIGAENLSKNKQLTDTDPRPANKLEQELISLWQNILQLKKPPGLFDDFFQLGGNSILATRVVQSIEQDLGINFPLDSIFRFSTISHLAETLENNNKTISNNTTAKSRFDLIEEQYYRKLLSFHTGRKEPQLSPDSLLMRINPQAKGQTLYMCGAFQIAKALKQYPIIAMDTGHGVMKETKANVHKLAAYYVNEIIQHKLPEPYIIIGYSQGAWVALEMAQILLDSGYQVPLLCQIDYPIDQPYSGYIAHFITDQGDFSHLPGSESWQQSCEKNYPAGVITEQIPGDHRALLYRAYCIDIVSERISARIEQLSSNSTPLLKDTKLKIDREAPTSQSWQAGKDNSLSITLTNNSQYDWTEKHSLSFGYHWYDNYDRLIKWSASTLKLPLPIACGQSVSADFTITALASPDQYKLVFDLLDNASSWGSLTGLDTLTITVNIVPDKNDQINNISLKKYPWSTASDKQIIETCQQVITYEEKPPLIAYIKLTQALRRWGRAEASIAMAQKGLIIYPDAPELHTIISRVALDLKQYDLVIKHADIRIKLKNPLPEHWAILAQAQQQKGEYISAIDAYHQAIKLNHPKKERFLKLTSTLQKKL